VTETLGPIWKTGRCTVCGSADLLDFFEMRDVPAQDGIVWDTRKEALAAPLGDILLSLCRECGYIGNKAYNAALVSFEGYDISLEHSLQYRSFVETMCNDLIDRYGIRETTVLEIACGNGFFLETICRLGNNKGIGYDPSYHDTGTDTKKNITFIQGYYTKDSPTYDASLICCRQILDELDEQRQFLIDVRESLSKHPDTILFFESPNAAITIGDFVPWNVVYEHCSWFLAEAQAQFVERCGFETLHVYPCNNSEYLALEARPSREVKIKTRMNPGTLKELATRLSRFQSQYEQEKRTWSSRLDDFIGKGKKVACWGAGARAIGFLSSMNITTEIQHVADINPRRQFKHLPKTGQLIVPPEFLQQENPDVIIITNPTYEQEIRSQAHSLALHAEFVTL
jgi:2-polyprenyl-3-methyl-5-hydroxy-6-metoxy-1,4-benzoquinol methylase